MKVVLGISGASGSAYAKGMLEFFSGPGKEAGHECHVVFSKTGRLVWSHELGTDPKEYGLPLYSPLDMTAPFASGSSNFEAMAVVPTSAGSMARIAHGMSTDLIGRAADVILKERRTLVLCLRESPYNLIHVRNMEQLILSGAKVMPASPNFYSNPQSMQDLIDSVVGRVLDQMGIENNVRHRWEGMK
jgi:4-hydroxy-3-polyprenylbenzoate decarboxylase